jgi:hypothetical protein
VLKSFILKQVPVTKTQSGISSRSAGQFHHRPRFIYLAGCDGTGKTTQAEILLAELKALKVKADRLWLRFPFFFCLPLLAYARWRGSSWYEDTGESRHGYWDFRGSWLLRVVFPWLLLLDAALFTIAKVYLPLYLGKTIVCERFVLDTLVDLSLAMDDLGFPGRHPGKLYPALLPGRATIAILDLDVRTIRRRRPDLLGDKRLEARLEAYRQLAAGGGYPVFSTKKTSPEVNQCLWELIEKNDPV